MDAAAAQSQISQMIGFIASEAKDKAQEIQKKGEEEFLIEVHRLITEQKEKVRQGYERKAKQIETDYAIRKSTAINRQRLEKIKARQEVVVTIAKDVEVKLGESIKAEATAKKLYTDLIVQGLLMFLEDEVDVRCREKDVKIVESILSDASSKYAQMIKSETGANKTCKLKVNKQSFVPASSLGGITLACNDGKITIDNTLDVRLKLVMEQDKPAIRKLLFPNA